MAPSQNPTRRNRNIGTAKQGHGQDNKLVIPQRWRDARDFYETLSNPRTATRMVAGQEVTFLVEQARGDCVHPCTVDDVAHILGHLPASDWEDLAIVVLRQPKRKEQILSPVWGRLQYFADFGHVRGPAVILEAPDLSRSIRWSVSQSPEFARELERLREDGHRVVSTKREWMIEPTLESARATMLYRTLLHEVGHWVDWLGTVIRPANARNRSKVSIEDLEKRYFSRPASERESAAHRYAETLATQLRRSGIIPFERKLDLNSLTADKLRVQDFQVFEGQG